ncbi:hypothetical protein B0T14DRAFT_497430 [Immersiella caudata]|uniref:Heterokaryon incompatibility domain-containing protein n=1 Tax=Immersiella caudata TaxID=314043 RepID=A0AA40C0P0_9PEZI|nr:hypothetical protein B0T14DRAFT_497430 [Immersiella caudata]
MDELSQSDDVRKVNSGTRPSLFLRPYFTRLWIVQEILTAGYAGAVVCGPHRSLWRDFLKALCTQAHGNMERQSRRNWFLGDALELMAPFNATDPRGKVYAAVAFAFEDESQHLPPDYNLSVQEVSIKVARSFVSRAVMGPRYINTEGSFLPAVLPPPPMDKTTSGLPSWVPH